MPHNQEIICLWTGGKSSSGARAAHGIPGAELPCPIDEKQGHNVHGRLQCTRDGSFCAKAHIMGRVNHSDHKGAPPHGHYDFWPD